MYKRRIANKKILDVGAGSGILSIYALKAGAAKARGIDICPFIINEAMKNAKNNHIRKYSVQMELKDISRIKKKYDVVIANVPMNIHELNAAHIADRLLPGGVLIAGGVLVSEKIRFKELYNGLQEIERIEAEDWLCFALSKQ